MVLATEKPNFLLASCCKVEVVKGAAGDFFPGFTSKLLTIKLAALQSFKNFSASPINSKRSGCSALKIIFIIWLLLYPKLSFSEPFVVLEYRGHSVKEQIETNNIFLNDLNHSSKHIVLKNETLSDIMLNYYGTKSFNNNILSLAIVHFNKNAFVRHNPNYLYSGKKLYLPSINEIKNLIIKKNKKIDSKQKYTSPNSSQIYFFGG